ncbi:MAG: UDP-N-acetylmuramate dehydrogenase [bacterium]|nr:UDP-N-acetylmuramate dehydrogenase [bacterium]
MNLPNLQENIPLTPYTTFRIGGPARWFVAVKTIEELVAACKAAWNENIPLFILAGGSNQLVSDEGFSGLVVKVECRSSTIEGDVLTSEPGASMAQLAFKTAQAGLTGFEWAVSVPGTVGGAIRGNAGAFGGEIKDTLIDADVLLPSGEQKTFTNADFHFDYRHSIIKENGAVVLAARIGLQAGDPKQATERVKQCVAEKAAHQPLQHRSSGCMFKNTKLAAGMTVLKDGAAIPEQFITRGILSSGWVVEQLGLKGLKEGDAEISEKHGNFVVNRGNAKAEDVLYLVQKVQEEAKARFGLTIELEVQLVGF